MIQECHIVATNIEETVKHLWIVREYRKTSNIIRTFLTIKLPGKSWVRIIHRSRYFL